MNSIAKTLIAAGVVAALAAIVLYQNAPAPTDASATTVKSEDLMGKVVVVDFWAVWCAPCIEEIPNYNLLHNEQDSDEFAILGITVESGPIDDVRPYLAEFGMEYPVVMGQEEVSKAFGGINAFPMTFVISPDWKIFKRYIGQFPPDKKEQIERDVYELRNAFSMLEDGVKSPPLTAGLPDAPAFELVKVFAEPLSEE